MSVANKPLSAQEAKVYIRFVFHMLNEIQKKLETMLYPSVEFIPGCDLNIHKIVKTCIKSKDYLKSDHGKRTIQFILYLNTQLKYCNWIINDTNLNVKRFVHGVPITGDVYFKLVDEMALMPFVSELIMSTPYRFCRDLVESYCNQIKSIDSLELLKSTESVIIALIKSIKREPVNVGLNPSLISNFNQIMMIYNKDYLPNDLKYLNFEIEKYKITTYYGYRVRSIFKILIELIKFMNTPDTYTLHHIYELKSIRINNDPTVTDNVIKQFTETIIYKLTNICDFTIDDWLIWFEIEVCEDDTNLQTSIGHLGYELSCFIDNGTINEDCLNDFRPILSNMIIEKIDFTNIDVNDIDVMITHVEKSSNTHLNTWIKKLVENHNVFISSNGISLLEKYINKVDFNCLKSIFNQCMIYYKNGGKAIESMGEVLYKGIEELDMLNKKNLLKFIIINHSDSTFYFSNNFGEVLQDIIDSKHEDKDCTNRIVSKFIWLIMQQPKTMLHTLLSVYIADVDIFLYPSTLFSLRQRYLSEILIEVHKYIDINTIYSEYSTWLNFDLNIHARENRNLHDWIIKNVSQLKRIKPNIFLQNILFPFMSPSRKYEKLLSVIQLAKFFLVESQRTTPPKIHGWHKWAIQLALILEDSRCSLDNYEDIKIQICDYIITCIQPILQYACDRGRPSEIDHVKKGISHMNLMTRAHFFRLWPNDQLTIDGMEEHFIMTVHSHYHISYSNMNFNSTQSAQEEFIFSIATYFPRFTLREMKCFVTHYMQSAKPEQIGKASYFFLGCMMNAFMRIIVYLKTTLLVESNWDYLENTINFFLETLNHSNMCAIYNESTEIEDGIYGVSKIIMVVKQMANNRQQTLLIVARRIIQILLNKPNLKNEHVSILLSLVSSVKTTSCRDIMREIIDILIDKIEI